MDPIRLLIADDHQMARQGLRALVENTEITIVAEFASGDSAVEYLFNNPVDLVLLDVRMPKVDGITVLSRIRLEKPDLPVLMISNYENPSFISRSITIGASGYLLKSCSRTQLLAAIRKVATGKPIWTRQETRRVIGAMSTPRIAADIEISLTGREAEILKHMQFGLSNKAIAQLLHISAETVKEHVQNILRKTGSADRTQAVIWAVRKGLI